MSAGSPMRTTSWGAAWIERMVAARTFEGTELSRGRGLAARGAVDEFTVEPGSVGGVVRGRSSLERRVRVGVRRFTDEQWATVRATLAGSSRLVAAVLEGALPEALHDRLEAVGCGLLPGVRDVSIDCSCGNLAESCVHAAAVVCRLAEALDADPLLLVMLRGGDRSALVQGMVPVSSGRDRERAAADQRVSAIPGRPADPTMSAATAWKRRLGEIPTIDRRRRAPGRPRVGAAPPSAELGFDQAGLDRLVRDAAARAGALLGAPASGAGLDLDLIADAVRRSASGTLAAPDSVSAVVAAAAGCPPESAPALTEAWRHCGPAGIDVLLRPRRLGPDELDLIAATFEIEVKARSTGAVLPGGRQIRRADDGTWIVLASDDVAGWRIVDAAADLDDLTID